MSRSLIDSNVLLDIINRDPVWRAWSEACVLGAITQGKACVNPIIYAELAPAFLSATDLEGWLDAAGIQRLELPYDAGWRAGQAFLQYRRAGGPRMSLLPDFYIGAHAEVAGLTLVTRDVGRYATYFLAVTLVTPGS